MVKLHTLDAQTVSYFHPSLIFLRLVAIFPTRNIVQTPFLLNFVNVKFFKIHLKDIPHVLQKVSSQIQDILPIKYSFQFYCLFTFDVIILLLLFTINIFLLIHIHASDWLFSLTSSAISPQLQVRLVASALVASCRSSRMI